MPDVHQLINRFNQAPAPSGPDMSTWAGISQIITDPATGATVKDAFRGGQADMVVLPAGTVLYKFNNAPFLQSGDDARQDKPISPWWSPYGPFRHDPGWLAKKHIAEHLHVSVREWGRVTSAVKENWNSLMWLCVITLKSRTEAAFGGFAHMRRIDPWRGPQNDPLKGSRVNQVPKGDPTPRKLEGHGMTANLPGGGTQFYIYNLKAMNVSASFEYLGDT